MRHAFQRIAREEGMLAFFNGLSASLLGLSHIMIQFALYSLGDNVAAPCGTKIKYIPLL